MVASRKQTRTDLKDYFGPLFVSANLLQSLDDFYKYEPADYGKRSPIVFLNAGGSEHPWGTRHALNSNFIINVHLLTLYSEKISDEETNYFEEQAADQLDDM